MAANSWTIGILISVAVLLAVLYAASRRMKPFFWRITLCLVPVFIASVAVAKAVHLYQEGQGGFKLGVDLVGGTILVYEVDSSKKLPDNYKPADLAAALKRRIDPNDLKNVTIRPVSDTRVEIILPTGGAHQARIEEERWDHLLAQAKEQWPALEGKDLSVPRGDISGLARRIQELDPKATSQEVEAFLEADYPKEAERKDVSTEEIQRIKELIGQVGSLEFRILANDKDDKEAIEAARTYNEDPKHKADLERRALAGEPPPPPAPPDDKGVVLPNGRRGFVTPKGNYTYSWMELGRDERANLNLDNAAQNDTSRSALWKEAAEKRNKTILLPRQQCLLYSRDCQDVKLPADKRKEKAVEYFMLVRDPEIDPNTKLAKAITGEYLTSATKNFNNLKPVVVFHFDTQGGNLFYELSSKNLPEGSGPEGSKFARFLAVVLDGQIRTAPALNSAIRTDGEITGIRSEKDVDNIVNILRSGALPATLKPQPVSENTMGATLGADTISKGTWSVAFAFAAILIFMIVYYRFAGLVACVALLANLLLTVAFMVIVNATFTLPGLAGLVLMIGMAVDANVLIYERLREERDRGASLGLAIRNGYDRAFPTIIDTHLSSIFTAIVLYAVGNDQLKGFGVSLTVGLIISLFTSLYMTRLLFDIWLSRNWLHKLSMFRLLSRPRIDFMAIRYYWFTATILLTLFGISVFLLRGKQGLDIDFVGGTAYGGQLTTPIDITQLRSLLDEKSQKERLDVDHVTQVDADGHEFEIFYRNPNGEATRRAVEFATAPVGPNATESDPNREVRDQELKREREQEVKRQAAILPDLAVEQIFPTTEVNAGNRSRYFTIRTSEKAPELVQASIDRLLSDRRVTLDGKQEEVGLKRINMSYEIGKENRNAALMFTNPQGQPEDASPGQVNMLLQREFKKAKISPQFSLVGEGKNQEGRFSTMQLAFGDPVDRAKLNEALAATKNEFKARPQPDRLENFDSQLAKETQMRAMYAIIASWGAVLLYLWFRFGNWTFGLATVLCLMHDLFFTMGIIAFCHYLHGTWLGEALLLQDFKINLPTVAALLTLVGYSVNDTIVVFDRIREVRGKDPQLTPQMINDSVNQTLSRTLLTAFATWLVVIVLYVFGGEGVHEFAFVMVVGVIVGTYSSIYIASPLLLIFGEGATPPSVRRPKAVVAGASA